MISRSFTKLEWIGASPNIQVNWVEDSSEGAGTINMLNVSVTNCLWVIYYKWRHSTSLISWFGHSCLYVHRCSISYFIGHKMIQTEIEISRVFFSIQCKAEIVRTPEIIVSKEIIKSGTFVEFEPIESMLSLINSSSTSFALENITFVYSDRTFYV